MSISQRLGDEMFQTLQEVERKLFLKYARRHVRHITITTYHLTFGWLVV